MILSAFLIVERRWAMQTVVRDLEASSSACWTTRSDYHVKSWNLREGLRLCQVPMWLHPGEGF